MTAKKKSKPTGNLTSLEGWGSKAPLPYWEIWLYISVWVGAVAYCIYSIYRASIGKSDAKNKF